MGDVYHLHLSPCHHCPLVSPGSAFRYSTAWEANAVCNTPTSQNSSVDAERAIRRPPGTLPLAGNGIWFLQPRHKLLDWFVGANRQTGFSTFEISVPSLPPAIVISDPKNLEHVLNNNQIFIKGTFFRSRSWDLFGEQSNHEKPGDPTYLATDRVKQLGNGIINADGDLWRIQRKAGLRFFSNTNLKRFLDEALPPILDDTEHFLDEAAKNQKMVDMQEVFLELTTRLMGKIAYDVSATDALEPWRPRVDNDCQWVDGHASFFALLESL